ncbi:MAG: cupin domain-containing protein [Proteobacteria bacterium]|nr:cupin domain-containing protein [Pseudomonadota bacterium]
MTIKRHPNPENLMSCAAGSMPEALAAVMACHMTICPRCRKELAFLDSVGAALLEDISPTPLVMKMPSPNVPARQPKSIAENSIKSDVPAPLRKFVGNRLADINWKRVTPGIWQFPIPLAKHSNSSLKLIKVGAGLKLPDHGHSGLELTLVLQGAFSDEFGSYEVGDVVEMGEDVAHAPVAAEETGCICLIASEGPMRFHGLLARIVQKFTGF